LASDKKTILEDNINHLVNEFLEKLENDKKDFIKVILSNELETFLNDSKLFAENNEVCKKTLESIVLWTINTYIKLLKTKIPDDFYTEIIKLVINGCYKAILICIEAEFDEKETLFIMENESHNSLLLGITILKDEELIDIDLFKDTISILDVYIDSNNDFFSGLA